MKADKPDLLDWNSAIDNATLGAWIEKSSIVKQMICSDSESDFYTIVYPKKLNYTDSLLMCKHLGGSLYFPKVSKSF